MHCNLSPVLNFLLENSFDVLFVISCGDHIIYGSCVNIYRFNSFIFIPCYDLYLMFITFNIGIQTISIVKNQCTDLFEIKIFQ